MRVPSTLLLISAATAFTSVPYCARSFSTGPLNACEICPVPVIIAGSTGDCLGAAMALCAKDELLNSREDRSRPSVPPSQMIAFFNELSDDQQQQQRSLSSATVSSIQNAIYFFLMNPPTIPNNCFHMLCSYVTNQSIS